MPYLHWGPRQPVKALSKTHGDRIYGLLLSICLSTIIYPSVIIHHLSIIRPPSSIIHLLSIHPSIHPSSKYQLSIIDSFIIHHLTHPSIHLSTHPSLNLYSSSQQWPIHQHLWLPPSKPASSLEPKSYPHILIATQFFVSLTPRCH